MKIQKTEAFTEWYEEQDNDVKRMVDARLLRVQGGNLGTVNRFEGLTELKWRSGLRVYTAVKDPNVIVLLGGNKNGQEKDIQKAKGLLGEIERLEAERKAPKRQRRGR